MLRLGAWTKATVARGASRRGLGNAARARRPPAPTASAIYLYKGADRDARLAAKAREEGTLTLYTSMATTESGPLAQAFEKKYGIKVQLWRALSENVLQRALTEARAGRRSLDVVETNAPEVEALAREQVVAEFFSPHLADLPAWAIPPHRRWASDRANLWVTGYNTGKVKREELPASYEGFADPKWKGRIALEATDNDWMYGVIKFMGEERGIDFFRRLAALKPDMRKGHILVAQLVAAGELTVCLTIYSGNANSIKAKGGPIDWVAVEPLVGRPQALAVAQQCAAPARRAAVRRFRAVAGGPEASRRHGPRAVEPHAEDAARPVQARDDRPDQMGERGAEVGEALERAVPEVGRDRPSPIRQSDDAGNETGALMRAPVRVSRPCSFSRSVRPRAPAWCRPCRSPR